MGPTNEPRIALEMKPFSVAERLVQDCSVRLDHVKSTGESFSVK